MAASDSRNAMHRVLEITQRLLAGLYLLGQREVEEMIVVESAERATERIEPVDKTQPHSSTATTGTTAVERAQTRADDRPSDVPAGPAVASITYNGRRRD